MFARKIHIADHEIALLYRNRAFVRVLGPGLHRVSRFGGSVEQITVDLRPIPVEDAAIRTLAMTHACASATYFEVADTKDGEVGVVFVDGKLADLVAPGEWAFYAKSLQGVEVRRIDVAGELDVPAALVAALARPAFARSGLVRQVVVEHDTVGLLYVNGVLTRRLTPGRYAFWRAMRGARCCISTSACKPWRSPGRRS